MGTVPSPWSSHLTDPETTKGTWTKPLREKMPRLTHNDRFITGSMEAPPRLGGHDTPPELPDFGGGISAPHALHFTFSPFLFAETN